MEYEYKDLQNRKKRDKTSEMLYDLPSFVTTFMIGREGKMSANTQYIYVSRIDAFFRFLVEKNYVSCDKKNISLSDLDKLSVEDIELFTSWIRHGNMSGKNRDNRETTINNYLSALNVFFKYFANRGKLDHNPVAGVERGRSAKHEVIRLNDSQKDRFFDCIENGGELTDHQKSFHKLTSLRDLTICFTLSRTGLRVSELIGLNIDDIDFDSFSFSVLRKGNKYDNVFFDDDVADLLKDYLVYRESILVDPSEKALFLVTFGKFKGTRLSVRSVERMVKKYAVAGTPLSGSSITPHKLRATYATDMLIATNNIALVQKALNHESPTTTMIYADARTIELEKARNTLKSKRGRRQ